MQRKKFIRATAIAGLGAIIPVEAMSKVFLMPSKSEENWFDGSPQERFEQLKLLASKGFMELSIAQFCKQAEVVEKLFDKLTFKIRDIQILTTTLDTLVLVSESKDFLFSGSIFKNDKAVVECEFKLLQDNISMLFLCKPDSKPKKLSQISGKIGDLLKPLDFIKVSDILYLFADQQIKSISSPRLPQYAGKPLLLASGVNLLALLNLSASGGLLGQVVKTIQPVLGTGPFLMCWNMEDPSIDFDLQIPQDIDIENLFKLKEPRLVIKPLVPVNISIEGIMEVFLPGIKVSVPGGFAYATDGIRGKFNMDKIVSGLPAPLGLPGVHLQTFTLSVGISNGIAVVGGEGKYYIGPDKPGQSVQSDKQLGGIRSNEFKFVFDAVPGKITPKFVYMYLDRLSLETYIQALTNQNVNLPAFLNAISVDQAMFHWCETPQGELKPDGTLALPIFGMSGIANIFGHRSFAELQVSTGNQSKGKLIAAPIDIGGGLLKVTGKGQGTPPSYKGAVSVDKGGMELMFDSMGPLYLSFSAEVKVLGVTGSADGKVRDGGLEAAVSTDISGLIQNGMSINFAGDEFDVATFINTNIPGMKITLGNIGTLKLNTSLQGNFQARYKNGAFGNAMQLKFDFLGIRFDLGNISTQVSITDLTKIVEALDEIIRDLIINKFMTDVLAFLNAAFNKAIEFVGDSLEKIGTALRSTFNKSLEESARLMKQVGYQALEVGAALEKGFQVAAQEVSVALKKAQYLAEETCEVLKDIYNLQESVAAKTLQAAGYSYQEVASALKNVYSLGDQAVAAILAGLGASANDLVDVLKNVFKYGAEQTAAVMKALNYAPEVVGAALKVANYGVDAVANVYQNVFKLSKDVARTALRNAGFPESVVNSLPSFFVKINTHIKFFAKL